MDQHLPWQLDFEVFLVNTNNNLTKTKENSLDSDDEDRLLLSTRQYIEENLLGLGKENVHNIQNDKQDKSSNIKIPNHWMKVLLSICKEDPSIYGGYYSFVPHISSSIHLLIISNTTHISTYYFIQVGRWQMKTSLEAQVAYTYRCFIHCNTCFIMQWWCSSWSFLSNLDQLAYQL